MCIIINNAAGLKLTDETIADCLAANPDGVGFYDLVTGELKKTLDYNIAFIWLQSETPFVAHCRYATCGEVCIDNVHPFEFNDKLLMMNGTISGYLDDGANDTRQLVSQLEYVKEDSVADFLECFAARFCIIDTKSREVSTIGKWVCRDGIEFSNTSCFDHKHHIAVYGTLKYGYSNHKHYLGNADFVDYATTEETYRLCAGNLPFLIEGPNDKGDFIDVEVYAVSSGQLAEIDTLEGHPHFYKRELCKVDLYGNGSTIYVWIYFVGEEFDTGEYVSSFESDDCLDHTFLEEEKKDEEDDNSNSDSSWKHWQTNNDDTKYKERDRDDSWVNHYYQDRWEKDDDEVFRDLYSGSCG